MFVTTQAETKRCSHSFPAPFVFSGRSLPPQQEADDGRQFMRINEVKRLVGRLHAGLPARPSLRSSNFPQHPAPTLAFCLCLFAELVLSRRALDASKARAK